MFLTRLPSTDRETLTLGMMVAPFPSQTLRSELEQEMSKGSSTELWDSWSRQPLSSPRPVLCRRKRLQTSRNLCAENRLCLSSLPHLGQVNLPSVQIFNSSTCHPTSRQPDSASTARKPHCLTPSSYLKLHMKINPKRTTGPNVKPVP